MPPIRSLEALAASSELISAKYAYPVEFEHMGTHQQSTPNPPATAIPDDQFLSEFIRVAWSKRWWMVLTAIFCAVGAGASSLLYANKYEATVLISPVSGQSNSGGLGALSSAVSQLGGIASLGLSMSGGGGAKAEAFATLDSVALTEAYIRDNDLLPSLFASKWDQQLKRWKSTDPKKIPTIWRGNVFFNKSVRYIKENPKTGLITLTITWTNPEVAAQWANGLVNMANDYLREKAIRESDRNIAYLNEQLTKTNVVELRNSIYSLMESEIKKAMLARGSDEYALKVIDPAVAPEIPVSPQRALWVAAGACIGLLGYVAYLFCRLIFRKYPQPATNWSSAND